MVLNRDFYLRSTKKVARDLVGCYLCLAANKKVRRLRIVETEAYLGLSDPYCHSFHGKRTQHVRSMYREGGHAYVYLIYGMYYCFNIVTGREDRPEAVLIRACEDENIDDAKLLSGPGKLCRVLGIDRTLDGWDITLGRKIWIEPFPEFRRPPIVARPRIGLNNRHEASLWPLRFCWKDHPSLSRK